MTEMEFRLQKTVGRKSKKTNIPPPRTEGEKEREEKEREKK